MTTYREVSLYCAARNELAEGPVWHQGALWWVNITAGTLNRLDNQTGIIHTRCTGDFIGTAVPTHNPDQWLIARRHSVELLDWTTGALTPYAALTDPDMGQRFNDGKADPQGRLLVGTLDLKNRREQCALYQTTSDRQLAPLLRGVTLSNGLAWSPDGQRFYYADTGAGRIMDYAYDADTGQLGESRLVKQFEKEEGHPDGMAADTENGLWVACWGAGRVVRLDLVTGNITHTINMPTPQPSSVCFGGDARDKLFITTAWKSLSQDQRDAHPLSGNIFVCETGFTGVPAHPVVL